VRDVLRAFVLRVGSGANFKTIVADLDRQIVEALRPDHATDSDSKSIHAKSKPSGDT